MAGETWAMEARKRRLRTLYNWIKAAGEADYKKVVAYAEIEMGVKPQTAHEYIEALIRAGLIVNENGILKPAEMAKKEEEKEEERHEE